MLSNWLVSSSLRSKFIGDEEGIAFAFSQQTVCQDTEKTVRLSSQVSLNKLTLKTHFS